jgi:hypothetical protein
MLGDRQLSERSAFLRLTVLDARVCVGKRLRMALALGGSDL